MSDVQVMDTSADGTATAPRTPWGLGRALQSVRR